MAAPEPGSRIEILRNGEAVVAYVDPRSMWADDEVIPCHYYVNGMKVEAFAIEGFYRMLS